MKINYLFILFILLFLCSCTKYTTKVFYKNQPAERTSYPGWYITNPELNITGKTGDKFTWKLRTRSVKKNKKNGDYAVFCLPVAENTPITISVKSQKGYPVIMATDRLNHKNEYYSLLINILNATEFPGRPLASSYGQKNKASLCINSRYNTVLNIWIWVTDGVIDDKISEEITEEPEIADSLFGFSFLKNEWMKYFFALDSFGRMNHLKDLWEHENLTNNKGFSKSKIIVTIANTNNNAVPLKDYFSDLYNTNGFKSFIQKSQYVDFNKITDWYTITNKYDSLKGKSIQNALQWKTSDLKFDNALFDISLESRLKNFTNNPLIQAALIKRENLLISLDSSKLSDNFSLQFAFSGGENSILQNRTSELLAEKLIGVGGISGAIYDRFGYLIASTTPFMYFYIGDQAEWQKMDKSLDQIVISGCYNVSGYPFLLKKVFIPIKDLNNDKLIGWLMAEIYCN